jgi:hypothetical protein
LIYVQFDQPVIASLSPIISHDPRSFTPSSRPGQAGCPRLRAVVALLREPMFECCEIVSHSGPTAMTHPAALFPLFLPFSHISCLSTPSIPKFSDVPSIRLKRISNNRQHRPATKPIVHRPLPPLLLVLLPRLNAKQPSGRRVVVALVAAGS